VFESRAVNIINSAINLIESMKKHYTAEEADELERRLLNSIKGQDAAKFTRGIRKVAEDSQIPQKNGLRPWFSNNRINNYGDL